MSQVRIKAIKNGPLEVAGPVEVCDATGTTCPTTDDPIYLCRCGQSANKPFCDGTHKKVGFQG
jgi:CDGSH-type Zn-finger protein